MKSPRSLINALTLIFVLWLGALPAGAQRLSLDEPAEPPRFDLSGGGGWLLPTDWSDLVLLGSVSPGVGGLEQILVRDLVVDPGPVYDGTVTFWRDRYGFRAHVGYGKSCLAVGRSCTDLAAVVESGTVQVQSYAYDVGGAIGMLNYAPQRWVWPYIFFGLGGVTYDLDQTVGAPLSFIERQPPQNTGVIVVDDPNTLLISVEQLGVENKLALTIGFGTDFKIPFGPGGLGVRLEVSDLMHESPMDIEVAVLDSLGGGVAWDFGLVHNLRASIGVVLQFGR
jgi:hypothetical protein